MNHSPDLAAVLRSLLGAAASRRETGVPPLWERVVDLGFDSVGVAEELGGNGGELADVVEIARAAGLFAPLLPFVENAVARHAVARARLAWPFPGRPGVLVQVRHACTGRAAGDQISGRWLMPGSVAVLTSSTTMGSAFSFVPVDDGTFPAAAMSGEPIGALALPDVRHEERSSIDHGQVVTGTRDLARLLRAAAITGAMETVCAMTVEHVRTREQFGRPLAAIPSVMHAIATMSSERDLSSAAVSRSIAADHSVSHSGAGALSVAACSGAEVARLAHQLHGAIGVTHEHSLHEWTRRIWDWRDLDGGARGAAEAVGMHVVSHEEESLWQFVTGSVA